MPTDANEPKQPALGIAPGWLELGLQVVAALGVIVSLIFVGVQMAQNTAQLRRAEANTTESQFQAIRLMITENPAVADLLAESLYGGQPLSVSDSLRLEAFLSEFTWSSFHIWSRARDGFLDKDEFTRGGAPNLARMLCTAQGGAWWERNKPQFVLDFTKEVDHAIRTMQPDTCPDRAPPPPMSANG